MSAHAQAGMPALRLRHCGFGDWGLLCSRPQSSTQMSALALAGMLDSRLGCWGSETGGLKYSRPQSRA